MKYTILAACLLLICVSACTKPMASAHVVKDVDYLSRDYTANANDTYYAVRWALKERGFPVESENLQDGVITTKWMPVGAGSHYIETFGRPDYGVTNSYHQLEFHIVSHGNSSTVKVGSRIKTLAANLKSSGTIERRVLDDIGNYLRGAEPDITNLGVSE